MFIQTSGRFRLLHPTLPWLCPRSLITGRGSPVAASVTRVSSCSTQSPLALLPAPPRRCPIRSRCGEAAVTRLNWHVKAEK